MVAQTVLPFKLGITKERMTPHAGLALFGEFVHGLDMERVLARELPAPGSGAGYQPEEYVLPLLLMLHGGGRTLEDLRQVRADEGLRELLRMERMPSSDATGDWLRRMGRGPGLEGLAVVNRKVLRHALKGDKTREFTLDIDATQIVAEKKAARRTYKGEHGYMPIVGHLAENGLVVGEEFREGNDSPQSRNLEFIRHCAAQMPKGRRIAHLRSDSAADQAAIFNDCEAEGRSFAIAADLDAAVQAAIAANWLRCERGWYPHREKGRDSCARREPKRGCRGRISHPLSPSSEKTRPIARLQTKKETRYHSNQSDKTNRGSWDPAPG